jgi:hypothetical protein
LICQATKQKTKTLPSQFVEQTKTTKTELKCKAQQKKTEYIIKSRKRIAKDVFNSSGIHNKMKHWKTK